MTYRVLLRSPAGKRHTIRLGRVNKKIAETARRMIDALEAASAAGHSPDRETAEWVGRLGDEIHGRLAKIGLVPPRERARGAIVTLGDHLEQFFASLGKQKPNTARTYVRTRQLLEEFFGTERTLESITEGDADAYRRWLLGKYALATVSVDVRRVRQFFKAAVRRRLIAVNPFADVPCGSQVNDARIVYVPAEVVEKVIAICPDEDWRMMFALTRFGGVRFPSEVEDLKWSDVDWANSCFTVHEKKLEHHPGRGRRVVPIFRALRPHLERAYRLRKPGAVYVVPRAHVTTNLGTHAKRLVAKAGVEPWPKIFTNLRGSCSDDLERDGVAEKAINAWIGNTSQMRRKHYHAVRREDWISVTGNPAPIPAPLTPVRGHQRPSSRQHVREKTLDVLTKAINQYSRQGSNNRGTSSRKPRSADLPGTLPGTLPAGDDVAELVRVLASLTPEERSALLALARSAGHPAS